MVGGVEPLRAGFAGAISLDLARLDKLAERRPRVADRDASRPGLLGPRAEALLAEQGLTLGHFPQSFEYSTVGGWVATRSAGQASTGYGRIDELVEGVRCVAPAGELAPSAVPASAAGPSLRELLVGSEGVLGVIVEATLRVRPAPAARRYEGWSFRSFAEGADAFRALEQAGAAPDVARLSDEEETRLPLALAAAGNGGAAQKLGRSYLRLRGHEGGCLAIVGLRGQRRVGRAPAAARWRSCCAPAAGWRSGSARAAPGCAGATRAPYLRDELLGRGVMVETLETATSWSNLGDAARGRARARCRRRWRAAARPDG